MEEDKIDTMSTVAKNEDNVNADIKRLLESREKRTKAVMITISGISIIFSIILFIAMFIAVCASWDISDTGAIIGFWLSLFTLAVGISMRFVYADLSEGFFLVSKVANRFRHGTLQLEFRILTTHEMKSLNPWKWFVFCGIFQIFSAAIILGGAITKMVTKMHYRYWYQEMNEVYISLACPIILHGFMCFIVSAKATRTRAVFMIISSLLAMGCSIAMSVMTWSDRCNYTIVCIIDRLDDYKDLFTDPSTGQILFPYPLWASLSVMKHTPAFLAIFMGFSTLVLALRMTVSLFKSCGGDIRNAHQNTGQFWSLRAIGVSLMTLGMFVFISCTVITTVVNMGYWRSDCYVTTPQFFCTTTFILIGFLAMSSYSWEASNRRGLLFIGGFVLIGVAIYLVAMQGWVLREQNRLTENNEAGEFIGEKFCVWNCTRDTDPERSWSQKYICEEVCIPKSKYCDGVVDLIGPFYRSNCTGSLYPDGKEVFPDEIKCAKRSQGLFGFNIAAGVVGIFAAIGIWSQTYRSFPMLIKSSFHFVKAILFPTPMPIDKEELEDLHTDQSEPADT